jgi:hypothetical protein
MKKTGISPVAVTFSLADFPSGERLKLEEQIIGRALELWRRKYNTRQKLKTKN